MKDRISRHENAGPANAGPQPLIAVLAPPNVIPVQSPASSIRDPRLAAFLPVPGAAPSTTPSSKSKHGSHLPVTCHAHDTRSPNELPGRKTRLGAGSGERGAAAAAAATAARAPASPRIGKLRDEFGNDRAVIGGREAIATRPG